MNNLYLYLYSLLIILCLSCTEDPTAPTSEEPPVTQDSTLYLLSYGALPIPSMPSDNVLTEQGVQLGRMLFYDPILSRDNTQSCASCHRQEFGFSDPLQFSLGVRGLPGTRQAMSVVNMLWNSNGFFWDGRSELLRHQALLPIEDELEMDESLDNLVIKLSENQIYQDQFARVYGDGAITEDKIALALEQFMYSIVSYDSRYDQWKSGASVLTDSEDRGRILYETEFNPFFPEFSGADCAHCHGGANLENDQYMNNGLDTDADFADLGREVVTGDPRDRARFKVPSLRNVALTAPYMHDGRFATLEAVVDHYNEGIHPSSTLDLALLATRATGLFLTEEDKVDLVNFLHTLTDESLLVDQRYSSPF